MRIIHTFWSAPSILNATNEIGGRNSGGWLNEKFHAISWMLSCLNLKKYYPDIQLYTDTPGAEWLVNILRLPYKFVSTELDSIEGINPLLWAFPKVYVYSKQTEPFLHVDGDVFIWKKFNSAIENSDIVVQNFEWNTSFYQNILTQIEKEFMFIPECLVGINHPHKKIQCINAGILGGNDISFIQEYACLATEFVIKNKPFLTKIDTGLLNPVFEQLILYRFALEKGISLEVTFEETSTAFQRILQVNTVPMLNTFIHTVAGAKQNPAICLELEVRLKYEHPKAYQHICSIYKDTETLRVSFAVGQKLPVHFNDNFGNTNKLIKKNRQFETHFKNEDVSSLVECISEKAIRTNKDKLLLDFYQLENAYHSLVKENTTNKESSEILFETIYKGLPYLYNNDTITLLNRRFELKNNFRIIFLNHDFPEITENYFSQLIDEDATATIVETKLLLMEIHQSEVIYSYLKDWEYLLYYFEGNPLTGLELEEMLSSDQSPFTIAEGEVQKNILHFLINQCYIEKRLHIIE